MIKRELFKNVPEAYRLMAMDTLHGERLQELTEHRMARQAVHKKLADLAEEGKVAIVWSGRDCDCVSYQGEVHVIEANIKAFDKELNDAYAWADGPCGWYIERVSIAKAIRYQSRDLILEAFEDGHQHCVFG